MEEDIATHWQTGEQLISIRNPLRFQGQYEDEESGLFYNLNRYYQPGLGRYITPDPVGLTGGLNSYNYVEGNPVGWIDPLGFVRGLEASNREANINGQGQEYAASVTEGGTGTAYSGHGTYRFGDGDAIVPPGTSITLPREGIGISDKMGQYIERGDWDGLANAAKTDARLESEIEGMTTWLSGSKIPNYHLSPPDILNIYSNSITVSEKTYIDILLKPNCGNVQWAACSVFTR